MYRQKIDWHDEFSKLAPFIKGQGGVARVSYSGDKSAPFAFLESLKAEHDSKPTSGIWRSIRIDPEIYSVKYLAGIKGEMQRKMSGIVNLESFPNDPRSTPSMTVFSDVEAKGNVTAHISNISQTNYYQDDQEILIQRRSAWIDNLCKQLQVFLQSGHLMIVINHGTHQDQDEFWRFLWSDGLEHLIGAGLFLVQMVNIHDDTTSIHNLAPPPSVEVHLPINLTDSAQSHAISDMADIFEAEIPGIERNEALLRADTLVRSHIDDIPRLHRQCSAILMNLMGARSAKRS